MNYGRYQIIREVGSGSMGVVYQAADPNIDRLVAVKVLRHDRISTEKFVRRFLKEAKVIGRLSHPNIVTIYDVGEDHGTVYIAMEYMEGIPLSELIRDKKLEVREALEICIQIAQTLDYAHRKGVVHRDIKPSNIIILPEGHIKITDFGIAHIDDSTATLQTVSGEIMGTPAYMSPEQVLSQPVDGRSDLFSLGVILYELCSGRRPFGGEGKNLATVFNEIIQLTPPEPAALKAPVSRKLSKLIMKLLEKAPHKRIHTGKALADALKECINEEKAVAAKTAYPSGRYLKYWIPAAAIAAASLSVAGLTYYFTHHGAPSPSRSLKSSPHVQAGTAAKPAAVEATTQQVYGRGAEKVMPKAAVKPVQPVVRRERPALGQVKVPTEKQATVNAKPPQPAHRFIHADKPVAGKTDSPAKGQARNNAAPALPARAPASPVINRAATPKTGERDIQQAESRPLKLPKFAFLRINTKPKGAKVYIDGAFKGTTPLVVKLNLGKYRVRLTHDGYSDIEGEVTLDKMTEYPFRRKMKKTG